MSIKSIIIFLLVYILLFSGICITLSFFSEKPNLDDLKKLEKQLNQYSETNFFPYDEKNVEIKQQAKEAVNVFQLALKNIMNNEIDNLYKFGKVKINKLEEEVEKHKSYYLPSSKMYERFENCTNKLSELKNHNSTVYKKYLLDFKNNLKENSNYTELITLVEKYDPLIIKCEQTITDFNQTNINK